MALRFHGFSVETAGTGADALARPPAHLIVLDATMPDGPSQAKRLGAERAATPIVFLTARDVLEDKIRAHHRAGR